MAPDDIDSDTIGIRPIETKAVKIKEPGTGQVLGEYETVLFVRTKREKFLKLAGQIEGLPDAALDETVVALVCDQIDLMVKSTNGARKTAGKVLLEQWRKEAITTAQVFRFRTDLQLAQDPT